MQILQINDVLASQTNLNTARTMSVSLRHDAIAETYSDVKNMLFKAAHTFAQRHNVPFDEMLSEAHVAFIKAFDNYNPKRGRRKTKFTTWLYFAVHCDLTTAIQKRYKHINRHEDLDDDFEEAHVNPTFFLADLRTQLSDEALHIVAVLLNPSDEFDTMLRWDRVEKGNSARCRNVLADYVAVDTGWPEEKVHQHFKEIQMALSQ